MKTRCRIYFFEKKFPLSFGLFSSIYIMAQFPHRCSGASRVMILPIFPVGSRSYLARPLAVGRWDFPPLAS